MILSKKTTDYRIHRGSTSWLLCPFGNLLINCDVLNACCDVQTAQANLLCQSLRLPGACLVCKQRGAIRLEKYAHHDLSLSLWNVRITQTLTGMCTYTPAHKRTEEKSSVWWQQSCWQETISPQCYVCAFWHVLDVSQRLNTSPTHLFLCICICISN